MEVFAQILNGFQFLTIFAKSSILDIWQDSEFVSEANNDFVEKTPSQMFARVLNSPLQPLIAKLLVTCLLNLINIAVLCTVSSTWLYFSTYLLNNENYNSVSQPCVSIDYAQNDRTSKFSVSKLNTGNNNFVPLDNNENKQINKQTKTKQN